MHRLPPPTARLRFRLWQRSDLALAQALWGDERVTQRIGGPFPEARVVAMLDEQIALFERAGVQYYPIFLRQDDRHVGCCGLRPRGERDMAFELGFHLRPEHWGAGLAREAAQGVIDFAFGTLGAPALFAGHHPSHTASRVLLERLGFAHTHDEFYPPTGLDHPSYHLHTPSAR